MNFKLYYETYWSETGFRPTGETDPYALQLLAPHVSSETTCLDIGCGDGHRIGVWLDRAAAGYTGVDISEHAVEEARSIGLDARTVDDVGDLPFPDGSFDLVVATEVLEHLYAPAAALTEARRVLRPGGVLVVTVPNIAYWRWRLDMAALGRWNPIGDPLGAEQPWRDPHIRFFTRGALARLLRSTGYADVEVGGHNGCFLGDIPYARRINRSRQSSAAYRAAERRVPGLLAYRLHGVGRSSDRPGGAS